MTKLKIGVLVGSLRKNSYSKTLANNLQKLAPESMGLEIIEIGNLAFYNEDYDDNQQPPQEYVEFRNKAKNYDGFIFVTPEYNRSTSAVLKNALDVGSRPYKENVWSNKPSLVISLSIGALGGFGAHHHLRQVLVSLNSLALPQPEVYLGNIARIFNEDGNVFEEKTLNYLKSILKALESFIFKLK